MFLQCCVTTQVEVPREALCTDMAEYLSLTCETVSCEKGTAERLDSRSLRGAHVALSGVCCAGSNRDVGAGQAAQPVGFAWFVKNSDDRRTASLRNTGLTVAGPTVSGLTGSGPTGSRPTGPASVVERCLAASTSSRASLPRSVLCASKTRGLVLTRAVATPP